MARTAPPPRKSAGKTELLDLPTEILEHIFSYCYGSSGAAICVRRTSSEPLSTTDIASGDVRRKWRINDYPNALLRVSRRVAAITFDRLWSETAFILSVSAGDALCFLKYVLSERQRLALRRVRFPRFILSWEDRVGDDIWLTEWKRAPAFLTANVAPLPGAPRVNNLVAHLQTRGGALAPLVSQH